MVDEHTQRPQHNAGFTMLELLVWIAIFVLILGAASWLLINAFRNNAVIWEQLKTQTEGRRAIREVIDITRRAEDSSIGSYPIDTADDYEFIFYANVDPDTFRERIRFWLTSTTLYKGTTKPTGTPIGYDEDNEVVTVLATDVVNIDEGEPVFSYFDQTYTGVENPLVQPVDLTDVHLVRIQLELEKDPTEQPVPLHVESMVHIRNLKDN